MGMVKQAIEYAHDKLQQAIKNRHNFKNLELCFCYYREATFWDSLDDGYDDGFADGASNFFADMFDNHFKTNFGGK